MNKIYLHHLGWLTAKHPPGKFDDLKTFYRGKSSCIFSNMLKQYYKSKKWVYMEK